MPVPKQIDADAVVPAFARNDVYGFRSRGQGVIGSGRFFPGPSCGAAAALRSSVARLESLHHIGRSNIFGTMASLFLQTRPPAMQRSNCTRIRGIAQQRAADLLIVRLSHVCDRGHGEARRRVIDVGVTRVDNLAKRGYSLVGDATRGVRKVASSSRRCPVGCGAKTIAMLLSNSPARRARARVKPRRRVTTRVSEPALEPSLFGDVPPPSRSPARKRRAPGRLREDVEHLAISVSTLTNLAREIVEGAFVPLWIRGEVTDFKAHRNGHWYFCLRDAKAQVRCVVWSTQQYRIPAPPDEGMQVLAFGRLTVYPSRGDMRFVVSQMAAEGDGLWRKALDVAIARLQDEGLLASERKRALVRYPRRVGIVTSPDGAALRDIIAVARRCSW